MASAEHKMMLDQVGLAAAPRDVFAKFLIRLSPGWTSAQKNMVLDMLGVTKDKSVPFASFVDWAMEDGKKEWCKPAKSPHLDIRHMDLGFVYRKFGAPTRIPVCDARSARPAASPHLAIKEIDLNFLHCKLFPRK
eukprot:TRINITY_DN107173_c0_g1_i1.p1 TRINITY_DN107173_c0_g1~~TRINITY_DN107173_c0_g1_i1.p1  ORF type:complete len:151 (-),score=33.22 TRINITY_DN107173_c0_g1_i1:297-701(-)